jgi:periplasmic divalent cation tolerance protein
MSETGCVQVVMAVDTEETAAAIAERLVEERLAACVQVGGPVTSRYRWEGRVETARELLLVAKTTEDRLEALTAAVVELHPYDVPEITAVPVVGGLGNYLDWIRAETARG